MFKKLLFSFIAFIFIFSAYNAYAFFGKNKTISTPYLQDVTYTVTAISESDFNDDIDIQATSTPNTLLTFSADWSDDAPTDEVSLPSQTTNNNGIASSTLWHKWGTNSSGVWIKPSNTKQDYNVSLNAKNPDGTPAASANYTVNITIPDTSLSNNAGITQNATVNKGTNVTFTCQNSSELYYGSSAGPSLVASKYSGASLTDYTLTYSTTLNTVGTFKVECDNIGGSATRKEMTFNVVENTSCPAPQVYKNGACRDAFDITNISSTPNKTNTDNTFTWTSTADTCNVYTNDKGVRLNPSASSKSGNNFSAIVPASNMPTSAGNYAYYIKCYSAALYTSSNLEADNSDPDHTGWKNYAVSISQGDNCPNGQTNSDSPSKYCHAPCSTGQIWNDTSKSCVANTPSTFDITNISSTPNQTNTVNTFSWTSTADSCNVYTNDKGARLNPSASSKSGNNFSAVVPANNMPINAGNYGYYIKCYSATLNPSSNLEADNSDPTHTGWKNYTVAITPADNNNTEFTISNINSTPNNTNTANTFTWQSDANDSCALYEYGNGYLYNTGGPVKIVDAIRNGPTWTANLSSNKTPSSPASASYYIGCKDNTRVASESGGVIRDTYNGYKGWKSYSVSYTSSIPTCSAGQVYKNGACRNTFDITSISSTPNKTNTANTFSWTSTADSCNVYTNDKATRLNPSASSKSGNNFSATVPVNNMPTGAGTYAYYIKCYSASLYTSTNLEADNTDPDHTGWKNYTVAVSSSENNTFNITSVNTFPNEISKDTTFSWWSDANGTNCFVYNYNKSESLGYAIYGSNTWSVVIPANKMPSSPGTYGYYINCYDTNKHADPTLEETIYNSNGTTYYNGWRYYSVYMGETTCPIGQTYNNGACVNLPPACPEGQEADGNGGCITSQPQNSYFDIYNFDISPKEISKDNTFTWSSEANKCDVYSYDFDVYGNYTGVKLNPSSSNRTGQNFSSLIPANNMPNSAGNYGYYIRCESTNGESVSVPANTVAWEANPAVGWKYFTSTFTAPVEACSNGQVRSTPTGSCHIPCPNGYTWNEGSGTCGNPNPSCSWADPSTKTYVTCNLPYLCENGTAPELRLYYKDGHYDTVNPPTIPFAWDTNQYQYQFYCGPSKIIPVAPLRKTYTHFTSFNISASNVQKGTGININWSVEDPNITCKIEGVSIKNPTQNVFNSKTDPRLDLKISTSTITTTNLTKDIAAGDYKTIIGGYWIVNQSTRFTASCTDLGTYKPGYYQLIRDIYVTGEEER